MRVDIGFSITKCNINTYLKTTRIFARMLKFSIDWIKNKKHYIRGDLCQITISIVKNVRRPSASLWVLKNTRRRIFHVLNARGRRLKEFLQLSLQRHHERVNPTIGNPKYVSHTETSLNVTFPFGKYLQLFSC